MAITIEQVRDLRERTGAGVLDAKNALEATAGDLDAAIQLLREKGLATAAKKAGREARDGRITSYIHGDPGRIGVLLEINCETDFVARTDAFKELAMNIAMQIAAADPRWANDDEVPQAAIDLEKHTVLAQMADTKKPAEIMDKIVGGKVDKWLNETVLVRQPYIRDNDITVGQLITNAVAELGENIVVRRFQRFELGEKV